MKVVIGNSWPYANGSLHLGRLASVIPGDALARYHRAKGDEVIFVSGSDCHGTPIAIKAKEEKKAPREIADYYHREFEHCFSSLGISYDLYAKTDSINHHKVVKDYIKKLYEDGYIYEKLVAQTYCESCNQFLPDRYIEGICPHCGGVARGDQCEQCSEILDPEDLIDKKCKICGSEPIVKESRHLFFKLSNFDNKLKQLLNSEHGWRDNAVKLTERYIKEGLRDRAVTRDLEWGIDVPLEGFEDKKIYVWIEAVLGYLSASLKCCNGSKDLLDEYWNSKESRIYLIHGKDNIPFHTVIFPSILFALGFNDVNLRIVSSEYLNLEGKKFSTSRNWAVWVPYIIEHYNPDSIRYFLMVNGPEKRDSDFSWREFINSHNSELLGGFGNFINRTLTFIHKNYKGSIANCGLNHKIKRDIEETYKKAGVSIENGEFKDAINTIFALVKRGNKLFDEETPWITIKEDEEKCRQTLYNCVQIIVNLANLLNPIIPFSCEKLRGFLGIREANWSFQELKNIKLNDLELLFERIDKKTIDYEVMRLKSGRI
ncbi:methionine--tRNA ligase [Clostridium folliculivorans]|uniref:Methionine--tRNA ligase n=1 Tax=Clostridium folliculivorans TaxID=2886038 RepID=A0A9W5Y425_9CLOT|nr:methionine--tRNA ligase [Clostridium folliculivorans]GKU26082.1 methionine--tRNA ligase 2 [Clostridium folliculivorans]GKU28168.1 methionine--tRNA ligase 2 [Clostridium folliculivorans]